MKKAPVNPLMLKIKLICIAVVIIVVVALVAVFNHDINQVSDTYMEQMADRSENGVTDSKLKFHNQWEASKIKQEEVSSSSGNKNSGSGIPSNVEGININGNSKEDNVDGFLVSWVYVCSNYEVVGPKVAGLQGHNSCSCDGTNHNVSAHYGADSVAHGPFQMDSKYQLKEMLEYFVSLGRDEFSQFILPPGSSGYMSQSNRAGIHLALINYGNEIGKVQLFGLHMKFTMVESSYVYLPESQLVALEEKLGKTRYEIHPAIISCMYAGNVYCGRGAGEKFIAAINPSMSNEQLLDTLLTTRHDNYCSTHNRGSAGAVKAHTTISERCANERELAIQWMADPNFDIYEPHNVPGKGTIDWGAQLDMR